MGLVSVIQLTPISKGAGEGDNSLEAVPPKINSFSKSESEHGSEKSLSDLGESKKIGELESKSSSVPKKSGIEKELTGGFDPTR